MRYHLSILIGLLDYNDFLSRTQTMLRMIIILLNSEKLFKNLAESDRKKNQTNVFKLLAVQNMIKKNYKINQKKSSNLSKKR